LFEVHPLAGGPLDLVDRVSHRGQQAHSQDVELQKAQALDVVLIRLDHPVLDERPLQRDPVHQVVAREHDPRGVQRQVTGEAVQPLRDPEQHLQLARVEVRAP
jgi:hypothetical protein